MPRLFNNSDKIFRDFIYVEDAIQANIRACNPLKNGTYNVGTGIPRSFKDIVDILQKELKTDFAIDYFENPYEDYQNYTQADISSVCENLGFKPNFSLEQGIKNYMADIKRSFKTIAYD